MEPEDQNLITAIMDRYKWDSSDVIDVQTMSGQTYKVVTSPSGYRHMDLSSVSTRDLLNECYRRRAIDKFEYKLEFDDEYLRQSQDVMPAIMKDLNRRLFEHVMSTSFSKDSVVIDTSKNYSGRSTTFKGEVYVCKHPTKVKK